MRIRSRHRISCRFVAKVSAPISDGMTITNLFRIAREAVNNAVKHARAGHIFVTLAADQQQIRLTVEDDGVGFPPNLAPNGGLGLHIMNYRAHLLGAALQVGSRPAGGTRVTCHLARLDLAPAATYAIQ